MLLAAAFAAFLLGLLHSLLGEVLILRHLARVEGLPRILGSDDFARRTLRWTWHLTTVLGWAIAAMLVRLAEPGVTGPFVLRTIAIATFACGLIALVGSRARHPGWVGFLVVAALAWCGA